MEPRLSPLSHDPARAARAAREEAARRARLDAEQARRVEIQRASLAALAAIEDDRERELVCAVDRMLGEALGSAEGYLPVLGGCPATRRLQRLVASYGVTPDHDRVRHLVGN